MVASASASAGNGTREEEPEKVIDECEGAIDDAPGANAARIKLASVRALLASSLRRSEPP